MAILGHYSPENTDIYIAGAWKIRGYVEGTFINISKNTQRFVVKESSDGVVSRSHSNSRTYTVEITLHSGSSSNNVLTRLSELDNTTKMGKFPLFIKDRLGSTLLFSPTSWIEKPADVSLGVEVTDRVWVFRCANTSLHIGGNEEISNNFEDLFNAGAGFVGGFLR